MKALLLACMGLAGGVTAAQDEADAAGPRSTPAVQPFGTSLAAGIGAEVLLSNSVVRRFEGDAIPAVGLHLGEIDTRCDINDVGRFVLASDMDGPTTADELILLLVDYPVAIWGVAQESGNIQALPGAKYGSTLESPVITRAGGFGFSADSVTGSMPTTQDDLLILSGRGVLLHEGVTIPPGQAGAESIEDFDQGGFFVSPDGQAWAVQGDLTGSEARRRRDVRPVGRDAGHLHALGFGRRGCAAPSEELP